jgi:hypothetical protein
MKRRVGITEYDCKKPKFRNYGSKTSSMTSITSNRLVSIDQISTESTAAQLETKSEIQTKKLESTAEISNDSIKSEPIKQIRAEIQTSTLTSIETEKKNTIQAQPIQFIKKEESYHNSEEEIEEISNDRIKSESIKQQQQQQQIRAEIQTSTLTSIETEKKNTIQAQPIQFIKKEESYHNSEEEESYHNSEEEKYGKNNLII